MNLFNRWPGFTRTPAGMERTVLRWLPWVLVLGTLLLVVPSLVVRLIVGPDDARVITTTDICVIGLVILHWTIVLTLGIASFIIMVMKGPAYVADAYPLPEAKSRDTLPE
jgi:hypothetical protein